MLQRSKRKPELYFMMQKVCLLYKKNDFSFILSYILMECFFEFK